MNGGITVQLSTEWVSYGEGNQYIGYAAKPARALQSLPAVVYADAEHAFFNDSRRSYHVNAARDAFARTLTFFDSHLSANS